jgi:hypothetical protein
MSLVAKALLTLVSSIGAWYALTPPQPPPHSQERVKSGGVERSFGSVVRIHALIWKVCCTSPCVSSTLRGALTNDVTVFSHRKPHRRARCLSIRHIDVDVVVVVAPLLLLYTKDSSIASTRLDPITTPSLRDRVSGDGRKWCIAPCMLPDARLALHVRAHIAIGPPTGDRGAVRFCEASEL